MRNFNRTSRSRDDRGPKDFARKESGGRSFGRDAGKGYGSRNGESSSLHRATCGECGKDCQVPFRPNGKKPVLCSNCFSKQEPAGGRSFEGNSYAKPSFGKSDRGSEVTREQFDILNAKLDRILKAVAGNSSRKTDDEEEVYLSPIPANPAKIFRTKTRK